MRGKSLSAFSESDIPPSVPNALHCVPRVIELMEADPEDTFYHFASGLWREVESHNGDTCKVREDMG